MWQQAIIAVFLIGVCVALIAIRPILGKGSFRIGHACRMKSEKMPSPQASTKRPHKSNKK